MKNITNHRAGRPLHILQEKRLPQRCLKNKIRHVDHIISHFFIELKNLPSFFIYHTHDDFNIADSGSMQDTCDT